MTRARLLTLTCSLAAVSALGCDRGPDLLEGQSEVSSAPITSLSEALTNDAPAEAAEVAASGVPGIAWQTPTAWTQQPPSNAMRLAQWVLPGTEGSGEAQCALFSFPGGGSIEANIGRWIAQFEQPDGSESAEHAERMTLDVQGIDVNLVQVTGTFLSPDPSMRGPVDPRPDHALFAAIFETTPSPHFLKCTGPRKTIGDRALELITFVTSFRFEG